MTSKSDFSADEWYLVMKTPSLVGSAVASAGRSGAMGTMKELMASVQGNMAAATDYPDNALLQAIIAKPTDLDREQTKAYLQEQQQRMMEEVNARQLKTPEALADAAIDDMTAVINLLESRATAQEVADYKNWTYAVAQKVAEAAKEGGFLGIGGERVSEAESAFLARLASTLGIA